MIWRCAPQMADPRPSSCSAQEGQEGTVEEKIFEEPAATPLLPKALLARCAEVWSEKRGKLPEPIEADRHRRQES